MDRRANFLMAAARNAERVDISKLNRHYESLMTLSLVPREGDADYKAYVTACRLAIGMDPKMGNNNKTCLLYESRDLLAEQQIGYLKQAAGIVAHKDFSW